MTADVVVTGGGPAGAATALALARRGIDVTIVERAIFPRRKVCGEYLGGGAVAALDRLGLLGAVRAVAQPLRGVRIVGREADPVSVPFPTPALACARERLDALLLDAAVAAGARLVHGRVEELFRDRSGAVTGAGVRTAGGSVEPLSARIVVGADGTGSVVARKAGLARPVPNAGKFAVGGHYTELGALDGYVEMYVGRGGYFAVNPLDALRANVMVVVQRGALAAWSRDVDAGISGEAAALGRGVRSLERAQRLGPRVAVGPLHQRVSRAVAPGVALVGDAAGFLDPFTGQGVYLALTGAERLAAAIAAGSPAALAQYADATARQLAARALLCGIVTRTIAFPPLARRAATRLAQRPAAAASLLESLAGTRATLQLPLVGGLIL